MKLICLFALVLASIPVAATEAVCIIPGKSVAQPATAAPIFKCGMPCCAKPAKALASCCRDERQNATSSHKEARAECHSQRGCKCELRVRSISSPTVALIHRVLKPISQAMSLPFPVQGFVPFAVGSCGPPIRFSDSSPPLWLAYAPDLGRAPPVV
jgi:hypothetical protein